MVELDCSKTAQENAAVFYEKAKKHKRKAQSILQAMPVLEKRIARLRRQREFAEVVTVKKKVRVREVRKKQWFERFHFFTTSNGFLVFSGKDSKQNEVVVSKHAEKEDLFFHADIQGASATILKLEGKTPKEADLLEAAQFAAVYSSAWKKGFGSVDVYSVEVRCLSKTSQREFVGKGAFVVRGKRKWFRNTELKLKIALSDDNEFVAVPFVSKKIFSKSVLLSPGSASKLSVEQRVKTVLGLTSIEGLSGVVPGDSEVL
ncbi:MAG: NFACT RNA binding domain-containing protein [Candidatus Micrarchaeia archaeon]